MTGRWEDEFAEIYRACAKVGLPNPREVDELEIWEVAAILGVNEAPEPEGPGVGRSASGRRPETGAERARRLERERPDWMDDPLTPGEEAILQAAAGGGG